MWLGRVELIVNGLPKGWFLGNSVKWKDRDLVLEQSWKEILGDGMIWRKKKGM